MTLTRLKNFGFSQKKTEISRFFQIRPSGVELKSLEMTKYKGFIDKKNSQGLGSRQGRNKVEQILKGPSTSARLTEVDDKPTYFVGTSNGEDVGSGYWQIGVIIGPGCTTFTSLPFFGLVLDFLTYLAINQQRQLA